MFAVIASAQTKNADVPQQQEQSVKISADQLLGAYYGIKDALVNGSGIQASAKATSFHEALKTVDQSAFNEKERAAFMALKPKLADEAQKIAVSKAVEEQRSVFASLSGNMWELLKSFGHFDQPVYKQYCPMKKVYWVSGETNIKNPYYGKQMLTCGKTTETIQ
ncbi:MAG: hypothetical protein BGO69_09015 [Bacteroidetes bacterium 46-16]|nr:MAG: hypothetical protein BGO69_09015 [Bacteroidetes bacterium 46-16]